LLTVLGNLAGLQKALAYHFHKRLLTVLGNLAGLQKAVAYHFHKRLPIIKYMRILLLDKN
jgi:hypothetical protein